MVEFKDTPGMSVRTQATNAKALFCLAEDSSLQVQAYWEPIQDSTYGLHKRSPRHVKLFDLKPAQPIKEYGADDFKVFLPMEPVTVGDVWALDQSGVLPILRQFHPGATASLHHETGQEGAFACLRALSFTSAEIVFRIHAEFRLDDADFNPHEPIGYFTPAQFTGRLVIDRNEGNIRQFFLHLPSRNSNVDINAFIDVNTFGLADMVFVPRMELIGQRVADLQEVEWDTAITEEEARKFLEMKFYKFAAIEWTSAEKVVEHAQAKNRPIHGIVLFGTLDDESC